MGKISEKTNKPWICVVMETRENSALQNTTAELEQDQ